MSLVRCHGDQCHIFLRALPGLLCILFLGHPSVKPHHLQVPAPTGWAGLCWQHHMGMRRDSGRLTTHSLEEALVLFWLLSVFLQCLGQQSRLPEEVFALVCLIKVLVPALVPRLSVGPRMVVPVNLSSWERLNRWLEPGATGVQQTPPASLCYLQNRMEPGTRRG